MDIVRVKLHDGAEMPIIIKGNMADLGIARVAILSNENAISVKDVPWTFAADWDVIKVRCGDVLAIDTGVAMELPEGWFSYAVPRSSTFLKFGLVLTNSIGIIDNAYKGDNDTWKGFFLCTRDCDIPIDTKLLQFQPIQDTIHQFEMVEVESLGNEDRGGFGSTDEVGAHKYITSVTDKTKVVLDLEALEYYKGDCVGFEGLINDVDKIIEYHNIHGYVPLIELSNKSRDMQRYRVGFTKGDEEIWIWAFNIWVLDIIEE